MYPVPVQELIDELGRLPGVGPRSAQRITFHLLAVSDGDAQRLAEAITEMKATVKPCSRCFNVTDVTYPACELDPRSLCSTDLRDQTVICVVEEPRDVVAVERTREYRGRYHVLQGTLNPMEGIGADQIRVAELRSRVQGNGVEEVIVCTNSTVEGEATAMYLHRLLGDQGIRITRPAAGLPVGSDLEYADEVTLGRALSARRTLDE